MNNKMWKILTSITTITVLTVSMWSVYASDLSDLLWTNTASSSNTTVSQPVSTWTTNSVSNDLSSLLWNTTSNTDTASNTVNNTDSNDNSLADLSSLLWNTTSNTNNVDNNVSNIEIVSATEKDGIRNVVINWYESDVLIELEWTNIVYNKSDIKILKLSNTTKVPAFDYIVSTNVKDLKNWDIINWKVYLSIQENVENIELQIKWLNVNRVVKYINRDTNQVQELAKITFSNVSTNTNNTNVLPQTNIIEPIEISNNVNNQVWNTWIEDHPILLLMIAMLLLSWYVYSRKKEYI